jgi:hypothetical protein
MVDMQHFQNYTLMPISPRLREYKGNGDATASIKSYQIQYYKDGYWTVYIDGVKQLDIWFGTTKGNQIQLGFETGSKYVPYTNFDYDSPTDSQSHYYRSAADGKWYLWSSGTENYSKDECQNYNYMPDAKFRRYSDGSIEYHKAKYTKRTGGI